MKSLPFHRRLGFAIAGILATWKGEPSFRFQTAAAFGALGLLVVLRPAPLWWALFGLAIGGVLGAELINTAIEVVLDHLHPEEHPMIARAKDCASGAVLVMSVVSVGVLLAMLADRNPR